MKNKANATLIGAFAVLGVALVVVGIIAAGGGKLFARKERVVMHFSGSIYGLQVGAPVVFRGVQLGEVSKIGLVYDKTNDQFIIPVEAALEPRLIHGMAAANSDDANRSVLAQMVARGLRAQLSMQSLLTGQLYVDLDLRPDKPGVLHGSQEQQELEIPTTATAIQQLKNQLDGLDLRRLLDDVSAIAESARTVVAGPQLRQAMTDVVAITGNVRRITDKLDTRVAPLADTATHALSEAGGAARKVGTAADGVTSAANRLGSAADSYKALVAPDSPLLHSVQQTADELSRTAASLRNDVGEDSTLMVNADKTLQDLSRAARSVRELADLLDRHPDALLRGHPADPMQAAKPEKQP